jgi:hypothetical protein
MNDGLKGQVLQSNTLIRISQSYRLTKTSCNYADCAEKHKLTLDIDQHGLTLTPACSMYHVNCIAQCMFIIREVYVSCEQMYHVIPFYFFFKSFSMKTVL